MNKTNKVIYNVFENILERNMNAVLLFGLSGVGICVDLSGRFPKRVIDAGIMEQTVVGIAAGMAIEGFVPIIYGQSPFYIERAYEQIKVDCAYQGVGVNFVLYGGSSEIGSLGATHCCPSALAILSMIPDLEVVVPGRPEEFANLFFESYSDGKPTIYRTSVFSNSYSETVEFGKANVIKKGSRATVLAVGPMLELALKSLGDEDVTILYYTTISPFDKETLRKNIVNNRLLVFEPSYKSGIMSLISSALEGVMFKTEFVGYPLEFIINHGYVIENAASYGFTNESVVEKYKGLLD